MAENKTLKQEQLSKVHGGFDKLSEFSYKLTYKDKNGQSQTTTITASGYNRNYAKSTALEKAYAWCNENGVTFESLE